MILKRDFYTRDPILVSKQLLGKIIIYKDKSGIITEVECYKGQDDPASHAYKGKTKRNEVMFEIGGYSYVYFIYGMYYCVNIVTGYLNEPSATLIRSVIPIDKNLLILDKKIKIIGNIIDGPGKICNYFGITKKDNYIDLCNNNFFYLYDIGLIYDFFETSRIGIKNGIDKKWRFVAKLK